MRPDPNIRYVRKDKEVLLEGSKPGYTHIKASPTTIRPVELFDSHVPLRPDCHISCVRNYKENAGTNRDHTHIRASRSNVRPAELLKAMLSMRPDRHIN